MMDLFGNSSDSEGGGDGHAAGASFMHSLLDTGGFCWLGATLHLWKIRTFLCQPVLMQDIVDAICLHMCI